MNTVYLISRSDMTPDHLRGGTCADVLIVSRKPGRTNMSDEERTEGWLGQTNDTNCNAHGEYSDFDELVGDICHLGFSGVDQDALRDWVSSGEGEEYAIGPDCADPLEISGPSGRIILPPCADGGYSMDGEYSVPVAGWVEIASYGDPTGWIVRPDEADELDMDEIAEALDAAGVQYDRLAHAEGTTSTDSWAIDIICVLENDVAAANAAIQAAASENAA